MDIKTKRFLLIFALVMAVVWVSAPVGSYAADIMSTSTPVKNILLCRILFIAGCLAGMIVCLVLHEFERRNSLSKPDAVSGNMVHGRENS